MSRTAFTSFIRRKAAAEGVEAAVILGGQFHPACVEPSLRPVYWLYPVPVLALYCITSSNLLEPRLASRDLKAILVRQETGGTEISTQEPTASATLVDQRIRFDPEHGQARHRHEDIRIDPTRIETNRLNQKHTPATTQAADGHNTTRRSPHAHSTNSTRHDTATGPERARHPATGTGRTGDPDTATPDSDAMVGTKEGAAKARARNAKGKEKEIQFRPFSAGSQGIH
ncbi:hypothetical protein BDZ91DRAFT_768392 [Kalaharituber pfeilii]|nr:hypothetical protein BDZ91DRAFT_768392 [Kalaharituber pfeilii]